MEQFYTMFTEACLMQITDSEYVFYDDNDDKEYRFNKDEFQLENGDDFTLYEHYLIEIEAGTIN